MQDEFNKAKQTFECDPTNKNASDFNTRVLKGEEGGYQSHPQPIFFRNLTSQCSNPIPTSRIWKKSQCYTYHLFSLCIRKITASKYDPTKTQKFTRIYKDVLEITGSFQTVIKL